MANYRTLFIGAVLLLPLAVGAVAADQPDSTTDDQMQPTSAVRSMFAAAAAEDLAKLRAVTAPDFYAFDAGGRFTRDALMDLIKTAHVAGKRYV